MVRILIISDIHLWSLPNEHDGYYKMRKELMKDVADYADANGPIQCHTNREFDKINESASERKVGISS